MNISTICGCKKLILISIFHSKKEVFRVGEGTERAYNANIMSD